MTIRKVTLQDQILKRDLKNKIIYLHFEAKEIMKIETKAIQSLVQERIVWKEGLKTIKPIY
jgi:hypothetical protein